RRRPCRRVQGVSRWYNRAAGFRDRRGRAASSASCRRCSEGAGSRERTRSWKMGRRFREFEGEVLRKSGSLGKGGIDPSLPGLRMKLDEEFESKIAAVARPPRPALVGDGACQ